MWHTAEAADAGLRVRQNSNEDCYPGECDTPDTPDAPISTTLTEGNHGNRQRSYRPRAMRDYRQQPRGTADLLLPPHAKVSPSEAALSYDKTAYPRGQAA